MNPQRRVAKNTCSNMLADIRDLQEKPKEKTIFNVKLESFDAGAKPKVIREVKALVPNLTLIDVCYLGDFSGSCAYPASHRLRSSWNRYPKC